MTGPNVSPPEGFPNGQAREFLYFPIKPSRMVGSMSELLRTASKRSQNTLSNALSNLHSSELCTGGCSVQYSSKSWWVENETSPNVNTTSLGFIPPILPKKTVNLSSKVIG